MAATAYKVQINGVDELREVLDTLKKDFGPTDQKKILVKGVKESMRPALNAAIAMVPVDTGLLKQSLHIEARKPTNKDRRSKYVSMTDAVVATVTTRKIPKKYKTEVYGLTKGMSKEERKKATQKFYESKGIFYDARAISMEFGTKSIAPRPFLRPALENNVSNITDKLGSIIKAQIEKYKARQAKLKG